MPIFFSVFVIPLNTHSCNSCFIFSSFFKMASVNELEQYLCKIYKANATDFKEKLKQLKGVLDKGSDKEKFFELICKKDDNLWKLYRLILDRNPSLSDDMWLDSDAQDVSASLDYDKYFSVYNEFACIRILPNVFERKLFRSALKPKIEEITIKAPSYQQINDLLDEKRRNPDKEMLIPELKAKLTEVNPDNESSNEDFFKNLDDSKAKPKFTEKFITLLKDLKDKDERHANILLEELANCVYLLLDGNVLPPLTGIQTVRRDDYYHRVVRNFLAQYSLDELSHLIGLLKKDHKELFEEFTCNLLNIDRSYYTDSFTHHHAKKNLDEMIEGNLPFNAEFLPNLVLNDLRQGFNREIPQEKDVIKGKDVAEVKDQVTDEKICGNILKKINGAEKLDPLIELIIGDDNFRKLTTRQIEEWYSTFLENRDLLGKYNATAEVSIDPAYFRQHKGQIVWTHYNIKQNDNNQNN